MPRDDGSGAAASPDAARAYNSFLRRFAADDAAGAAGTPASYADAFPAAARRIRAFFGEPELDSVGATAAEGAAEKPPADGGGAELPRRIGPYAIEALLGRGGQGEVYLARDERLGRRVALKICRATGAEERARFRREAELGSRLDHPGLCPVYEAGEADGAPYLAMRYVAGRSLEAVLAAETEGGDDSGLSAARRVHAACERAARVVAAAARALHAAHLRGVVHRDVKPANLVLGPDDAVTVVDFGVAREADAPSELTAAGVAVGTPAYLAPEQIDASGAPPDARVDVYALGVVLFRMIAGRPPFVAETRDDLFRAVLLGRAPSLAELRPRTPVAFAAVVRAASARDPRDRYASAAELADDLERFLRGERVHADPDSPVRKLRRYWRRRGGATIAAAVALTALGAGVGAWRKGGDRAAEGVAARRAAEADRRLLDVASLGDRSRRAFGDGPEAERAVAEEAAFAAALLADRPRLEMRRDELAAAARAAPEDAALFRRAAEAAVACEAVARLADPSPAVSYLASLRLRARFFAEVQSQAEDPAVAAAFARALAAHAASAPQDPPLRPDFALLPLGANAQGRQEFVDLWTGEPAPEGGWSGGRKPESDGFFRAAPGDGIVYVLVPGDGGLAPFLLAKDELAQGVVRRMAARDPDAGGDDLAQDSRELAQRVGSAAEWTRFAALLRARAPSEAEWERAAAGGGAGPFPWGEGEPAGRAAWGPGEDGLPRSRYPANGFGFHDFAGGLAEWCTAGAGGARFVLKGGAWNDPPEALRIKARRSTADASPVPAGFRPARNLASDP